MEGLSPKVVQALQAKELYNVLETIFEEMKVDWASVREDEDSQIIQLAENSICCGTVYEVDVCMNFRLCLHLLGKYGLAIPYPKTFEMAFLLLNEQRGLYTAPVSGKKMKKKPSKKMVSDWANLEGGRCRSLVMYAIRLTRKTRNARLPEIQALKDVIVALPGYEASTDMESGDSDEGLAYDVSAEDSQVEAEAEESGAKAGRPTHAKEASLPATSNAKESSQPTTSDAKDSSQPAASDAKDSSRDSEECPVEVGNKEKVGAALRDTKPLLPEGAVIPPGIGRQLESLAPEDAQSLLQAQMQLKAEIRCDNKKKAAAKSEAKAAKAKAKGKAKASGKKRKAEENDDPEMEKAEEPNAKARDANSEQKPKLSKDHTVEDMLDLLEPAFQIGLPKPSDSQKLKKCYTVPAPGLSCASISILAGATKNFFVNKGAEGGLPGLVRSFLGLKMDTNYNTGISIRKFGAAFAWEIALVVACHRALEPPAQNVEDLRRRFSELFSYAPANLAMIIPGIST